MALRNCILLVVTAALASAALVLLASSSFVRDGAASPGPNTLHLDGARPTAFIAASSGVKVHYVDSGTAAIAPGADNGFELTCPKKFPHPVAGYGGPNDAATFGKVVLSDSYPRGGRHWAVGMKNLTDQPQKFFVGIVCVA
jgi:hypothetical protein